MIESYLPYSSVLTLFSRPNKSLVALHKGARRLVVPVLVCSQYSIFGVVNIHSRKCEQHRLVHSFSTTAVHGTIIMMENSNRMMRAIALVSVISLAVVISTMRGLLAVGPYSQQVMFASSVEMNLDYTAPAAGASMNTEHEPRPHHNKHHSADNTNTNTANNRPPQCTVDQLLKVRSQLIPELCLHDHQGGKQYRQLCSITTATKCPNATWLDEYYAELYEKNQQNQQHISGDARHGRASSPSSSSFLGISIGCNKGFDAISTLRMGTFDNEINKVDWKKAMTVDGEELHSSVCKQDTEDENSIFKQFSTTSTTTSMRKGEMHCIEPMPQTFQKLKQSSEDLRYNEKGLVVTHAAVSKESGEMLFHTAGMKSGIENKGLGNCQRLSPAVREKECESVPVYSLNDYVKNHTNKNQEEGRPINILSIDVEGFDGDVLLGAGREVLERVEYLEFEYNWMGSWAKQHLYDIVEMLDEHNLTCYWAGKDQLWRITDCWMLYFDIHTWSNVACVSRSDSVQSLASKMEDTFQRTLKDDKVWLRKDKVELYNTLKMDEKITNHIAMSINETDMKRKYL